MYLLSSYYCIRIDLILGETQAGGEGTQAGGYEFKSWGKLNLGGNPSTPPLYATLRKEGGGGGGGGREMR